MKTMKERLSQLWQHWREISECIGDFQARLLLTIFYFTVLVPSGIVSALAGDPLEIYSRPKKSGWIQRQTPDLALRQERRQF
jgi:hypothetical protein